MIYVRQLQTALAGIPCLHQSTSACARERSLGRFKESLMVIVKRKLQGVVQETHPVMLRLQA